VTSTLLFKVNSFQDHQFFFSLKISILQSILIHNLQVFRTQSSTQFRYLTSNSHLFKFGVITQITKGVINFILSALIYFVFRAAYLYVTTPPAFLF
jgi:hypothetical protein